MENYISIHNSAPNKGECNYYRKGKRYTYEEYCKLIYRRQQIKNVVFAILFGAFMIFRAYAFLEYGI